MFSSKHICEKNLEKCKRIIWITLFLFCYITFSEHTLKNQKVFWYSFRPIFLRSMNSDSLQDVCIRSQKPLPSHERLTRWRLGFLLELNALHDDEGCEEKLRFKWPLLLFVNGTVQRVIWGLRALNNDSKCAFVKFSIPWLVKR